MANIGLILLEKNMIYADIILMYNKPILSSKDLQFFKKITFAAGQKASVIQRSGFQSSRKDDTTIVTEADKSTQDYLVKKISNRFKEMNFVYEENFDRNIMNMADGKLTAIIDPIDGTAMFSMNLPFWCVSVGIFSGFEPVYGFIYSPGCNMFFYNDDENALCNEKIITADKSLIPESETNIFFASELIKTYNLTTVGKIRNLGSTALHAVLIANNIASRGLAFIGSGNLWDWAGAIPILAKANCNIKYLSERDVVFKEVAENRYEFPETLLAYSSDDFNLVKQMFELRNTSAL